MTQMFTAILAMSKTASFVILAVILTRVLLRRAPKLISYLLWSVVFIRLLCPFSFSSPVYGLPEQTYTSVLSVEQPPVLSVEQPAGLSGLVPEAARPEGPSPAGREPLRPMAILGAVWALGVGGMSVYAIVSYGRLKRKLAASVRLRDNIYLVDYLETPFVMGMLHPKIYLPSTLEKRELVYILAHEQYHIRRLDHLVKPIGFLALCLHWFNPLVWAAFLLFCKDMEMSCDEAVIKQLGEEVRADYSSSLLSLATGRQMISGVPLAFGEGDTKARIRNLKNWKKPVLWIVVLAGAVCALLAVFLLTNRTQNNRTTPFQDGTVVNSDEKATPEQAAELLIDSIRCEDDQIRFTIPKEYAAPEDWVIRIFGRAVYPDGMSMSLHYLEGTVWEAGKEYAFQPGDGTEVQLELTMELALKGVEREVDLSAYLPRRDPIPLTEESAEQCMVQVLSSLVLREDGTVSFVIPDPLPESGEKDTALHVTLHADYQAEDHSRTTQHLLKNERAWRGGETYTGKLDLTQGELQRVFLRVAVVELSEGDQWKDCYPAKYIELFPPFSYDRPANYRENTISAAQTKEQVTVDLGFVNAPPARLVFTLPEGISLGDSVDHVEALGYLLTDRDGNQVGELFFMELAAAKEELSAVEPSKNELPMQIYAGAALPNHIMYEDYEVHQYGGTFAAATALVSSQELEPSSSAAGTPFGNEKNVVLFYDYEKLPVFMQISFDPTVVSKEACADIARSVTAEPVPAPGA